MSFHKNEVILNSIKWNYEHQDLFYLPQWQTGSKIDISYLIYRLAYASFYVTIFLIVLRLEQHVPIALHIYASVYYTCWHFFLCSASSIISLISVFKEYIRQRRNKVRDEDVVEKKCSSIYKVQWVLLSVVADSSVALCFGYYTMVHSRGSPYTAQTSVLHLWIPLLVIMDFMICGVPAKLIHGYASLIVGIIYAIFTYIYYISGGLSVYGHHYLYKIIDYKHSPGLAVLALFSSLICMVVGRIIVYLIFLFRHKIYWKFYVLAGNPFEVTRYVYEINK